MKPSARRRAKEPPKPRILLLFVMMAVFIATPLFFGFSSWAAVPLGIFCADIFYFLLVALKVQRNLKVRLQGVSSAEQQAHSEAAATARKVAQSGIVLLQNSGGLLPLAQGSRLNLLGLRCVQMNFNGGGSAASDESQCTTLPDALRQTGFLLNEDLLNLSANYLKNGKISIQSPGKNYRVKQGSSQKGGAEFVAKPGAPVKTELPAAALTSTSLYPDGRTVLDHARDFSDTALIVLSRGGGEGYDLDPADLRLIESERQLLDAAARTFDNIILVLNTANTVEMGWLADYPQIRAVLWVGFPGTAGNLALGDILNGAVSPSGRLPDTWAASNLAAPAANNYCERTSEGRWSKESFHYRNAPERAGYFVRYSEGIYVGYRYFETRAAVDKTFDYDKEVIWPFGYGLSYTTFTQKIESLVETPEELALTVTVQNTGSRPGKEAVQCYLTAPYTGRVERSAAALAGYDKTRELAPGETQTLILELPRRRLAAFEEASGQYLLEAGEYGFSLRSDSHTVLDSVPWHLEQEQRFEGTQRLFADADTPSLTRAFDPAHPAFTGPKQEDFTADEGVLAALQFHVPTDAELGLTQSPPTGRPAGLKLADLRETPPDSGRWDTFVQQLTLPELCSLCGNGAWQTIPLPRLGVPRTVAPDGPTCMAATVFSALVMGTGRAGITWPCPSVLAAAFDPQLAAEMGSRVGAEGRAMGYRGWYAPAMNLHRTAFNSRNFEYYSEDPLLSGKTAARVVRGVQSHKVGVYIKHFALNERETNARSQLFTWCGEQAMRELYLLPFELAVREGGAWGVMSCFNYIGHTWAGGHKALLTDLLRKEWGFAGAVVTDACLYPHMDVTQMVYAGGDLSLDTLGGFTGGNSKRCSLLAAAQDPAHRHGMVCWLQNSAKHILYMVARTMD